MSEQGNCLYKLIGSVACRYVNMSGECQECSVCVDTSHIHLDSVFITVPAQCLVMLRNQTKVATRFHWTTVSSALTHTCTHTHCYSNYELFTSVPRGGQQLV